MTDRFSSVNSQMVNMEDIRNKEFHTVLRGADPKEVREFMIRISETLEKLEEENRTLKLKISEMEEKSVEFRQMESVLRSTLAESHGTATQLLENARKEAELIKEDARREAEVTMDRAKEELESVKSAVRSLNGQRLAFLHEMEGILESYGRIVTRLREETVSDETKD